MDSRSSGVFLTLSLALALPFSGGGIFNDTVEVTVVGSTISTKEREGILNWERDGNTVAIDNSTISGNRADRPEVLREFCATLCDESLEGFLYQIPSPSLRLSPRNLLFCASDPDFSPMVPI
jgi:hypothetical protein